MSLDANRNLLTVLFFAFVSRAVAVAVVALTVFFAVPPRKVFRLLKSPLNSLRGHFPVTTTLALKMMDYYTLANDKKDASNALAPLLREPFFADTYTGSHLLSQIQFYFRYSLDLLHEKALLDKQGKAYGLSTLATQMHAADPSNYGFVALLESGHIANICKSYEQDKNGVARELLGLLAHLFYRVPAPAHVTRANFLSGRESANQLLLPPLPPVVRRIIGEHNAQTMRRFTNFVRTFSKLDLHKVPVTSASEPAAAAASAASSKSALPVEGTPPAKVYEGFYQTPVSGLSFPWVWSKSSVPKGSVMEALFGAARSFDARSPFVALSGHADDDFTSARAMADSVRNGIFLDSKLIPVCTEDLDSRGNELQLNAYVVDFYRNSHFYSLIQDNRLSDGTTCKAHHTKHTMLACNLRANRSRVWGVVVRCAPLPGCSPLLSPLCFFVSVVCSPSLGSSEILVPVVVGHHHRAEDSFSRRGQRCGRQELRSSQHDI